MENRNQKKQPALLRGGVALMFLASASFGTMAAFVKALGEGFPVLEATCIRGLVGIPILLIVVKRAGLPLLVKAKKLLLVRSLFGTTAMCCFFFALERLALADSILIGKAQPVFVAILAPFLLGERATKAAVLAIAAGLAGAYLVLRPTMGIANYAGLVCVVGAFFSALAHIFVRKLNVTDKARVIVLNFTVFIALFSGLAGFPFFILPTARQIAYLVAIGIFATIGQLLMTRAYSRDRAPIVAAAAYASVVLSVVYGFLFWKETPEVQAIIGGLIIIASGVALALSRREAFEPPTPGLS